MLVMAAMMLAGCASPPSVVPLIAAAERVMADERRLLAEDDARRAAWIEHQRAALGRAFDADLAARDGAIEAAWVRDGVTAYVAAREHLLRHEIALDEQSERRRENLDQAAQVVRRAIQIIEGQDRLFDGLPDLRRMIGESNTPSEGGGR